MKHTKLLVVALLVALMACLAMNAMADECLHPTYTQITTTVLAPTCVTKGVAVIQCTTCGKTIQTIDIPATGRHTWKDTDPETVAPDCGHDGYTKRTCTVCGHAETVVIPASGNHDFSKIYAAAVPPTCIEAGAQAWYQCSVCNKLGPKPAVIPALGHDFNGSKWDVIVRPATCATEGLLGRVCTRTGCGYLDVKNVGKTDYHTDKDGNALASLPIINDAKDPDCTTPGCTAIRQCPTCGVTTGGAVRAALGHDLNGVEWTVKRSASCATDGILERICRRCGESIETKNVGKTAYHSDKNGVANDYNTAKTTVDYNTLTVTAVGGSLKPIIPAKNFSCTTDGCTAVWQCPTCGATKGGEVIKARGHQIAPTAWAWKDGIEADCTTTGVRQGTCSICGKVGSEVTVPAYGHSAVWQISEVPTATKTGMAQLFCTRCKTVIGMQILNAGDTLPSGAVNTGAAAATSTAKSASTKTSTAKTTSTKSASTSASTKTAAAPATTETKKVATVAAVAAPAAELEANQAQLVADKHLYVVKNVAGEEIVLTVNVADGKITVEAALAEGESLVLYANAEAIENPTAENTLVLTANEAVELPEAFANAIVAVVKTESLPTAVAAK